MTVLDGNCITYTLYTYADDMLLYRIINNLQELIISQILSSISVQVWITLTLGPVLSVTMQTLSLVVAMEEKQ